MKVTGGFLKNHPLKSPKGNATRPTSEKLRQAVFNICQHHIEDADFLDLYAGSGAMGIEALSRGARSATLIEKNRSAANTIRENINDLDLSPLATLYTADVLISLPKLKGQTFHLIYVDPPYEKQLQEKTLHLIDSLHLLHIGGILFIEESASHPLEIPELKTLSFTKKRTVGSTTLYQFK